MRRAPAGSAGGGQGEEPPSGRARPGDTACGLRPGFTDRPRTMPDREVDVSHEITKTHANWDPSCSIQHLLCMLDPSGAH